jgi:hypothetical protein
MRRSTHRGPAGIVAQLRQAVIEEDPMKMHRKLTPVLGLASVLFASAILAGDLPLVTVYKSPTCGCCGKWAEHMREAGFEVKSVDLNDMSMIKSMAGVPTDLVSCHTARVGRYVIEGHVPAEDVKRLLAEHPAVRGLSAPGMPQASPGMDHGDTPYRVLSFDARGSTRVYAQH